jgi:hypothetical protein
VLVRRSLVVEAVGGGAQCVGGSSERDTESSQTHKVTQTGILLKTITGSVQTFWKGTPNKFNLLTQAGKSTEVANVEDLSPGTSSSSSSSSKRESKDSKPEEGFCVFLKPLTLLTLPVSVCYAVVAGLQLHCCGTIFENYRLW